MAASPVPRRILPIFWMPHLPLNPKKQVGCWGVATAMPQLYLQGLTQRLQQHLHQRRQCEKVLVQGMHMSNFKYVDNRYLKTYEDIFSSRPYTIRLHMACRWQTDPAPYALVDGGPSTLVELPEVDEKRCQLKAGNTRL